MPPPMERLMELYRAELVLFCATAAPLQRLLAGLRARGALSIGTGRNAGGVSGKVTIAMDVDPLHML
jgi:hypothetical protein